MMPSIDPEKVALREELARQMAEFERQHGPVETLPNCVSADYDGFTTRAHREAMREKSRKAAEKSKRAKVRT